MLWAGGTKGCDNSISPIIVGIVIIANSVQLVTGETQCCSYCVMIAAMVVVMDVIHQAYMYEDYQRCQ